MNSKHVTKNEESFANISEARSLILKENPPTQRTVEKPLNFSFATVIFNKIMNCDLNFKRKPKMFIVFLLVYLIVSI